LLLKGNGDDESEGAMKKSMAAVLALFIVIIAVQVSAQTLKELRVSAIPDENPQELLRIYKPFEEYLSKELKMPVRFTPVVDYAATVEGLAAAKLDLVWFGAVTSVQATRRAKGATRKAIRKERIPAGVWGIELERRRGGAWAGRRVASGRRTAGASARRRLGRAATAPGPVDGRPGRRHRP
jgi:hypothetical protein